MSSEGLMSPLQPPRRQNEMAQFGSDAGLIVRFFKQAVANPAKSDLEGKPVFEDRDFVQIVTPGGKSDLTREVIKHQREEIPPDTTRWHNQWQAYLNQQQQVHDGVPLENWPAIAYAPAAIKGFKVAEVYTVEQLANFPDSALGSIPVMDGRKWRDLAIKFVEQARGGAPITALKAENDTLKADMAIMREQIAALAANQKKTPGRKPAADDLPNPLGDND